MADAWGINVHYDFNNSVYGDEKRVTDILLDLGVRHIRNRYKPGHPAIQYGFRRLANNGCRVNAICGVFDDRNQPTMAELMDAVVSEFGRSAARVFSAFEGINEPNNNGIPWVEETRRMQSQLWWARSARTQTASIPVVGPALARRIDGSKFGMTNDERTKLDYQRLGDLSSKCTRGNIHVYPPTGLPSEDIDEFQRWSSAAFPGLPTVCSEGGYWSALNHVGGACPVPEDVAAKYVPRQLMEHFTRNNRFFSYELLDDPDPTNSRREANFGFFRSDSSPKPQFLAMRRLLQLIGDRGAPFRPTGLRHSVTGGATDLRSVLLQKRDGVHYLCLWRDVKLYDWDDNTSAGTYMMVSPQNVTITLEKHTPVRVHEFSSPTWPSSARASRMTIDLAMKGELVVVEIG